MKGRMNANLWKWTGINAAALMLVLLLAYGAGAAAADWASRISARCPRERASACSEPLSS